MNKYIYILILLGPLSLTHCAIEESGKDSMIDLEEKHTANDTVQIKDTSATEKIEIPDLNQKVSVDDQWIKIVDAVNRADIEYLDTLTRFESSRYRKYWKYLDLSKSAYSEEFSKYKWQDLSSNDNLKFLEIKLKPEESHQPYVGNMSFKFALDTSGLLCIYYCKAEIKIPGAVAEP